MANMTEFDVYATVYNIAINSSYFQTIISINNNREKQIGLPEAI